MNQHKWVIVFLMLIVWGCKPSETRFDYKLTHEQLAHLMMDIQLSELVLLDVTGARRDSLRDLFWLRFTEIYKLSESDIKAEIQQLEEDPKKMKLIMNQTKIAADSIR